MASRFASVTEEPILSTNEAAVAKNTKKNDNKVWFHFV